MTEIITRYPPSPTGEIHIGNMRTMLFNYLYAKKHGGKTVLRFEDTDRERSDQKYEQIAIDALNTLGLSFDDGPYRQSERTDVYREKLAQLIEQGLAYEAEESSDGSGNKVVRFRNPNTTVSFTDAVRGEISIDTTDFGDFVIARSINDPIYHFTVVVDDMDMGVTDVIRGEDHITSTPRQILLIDALGGSIPRYAHLPLIIGDDKKKLSKRHGAVTVGGFTAQGYLPEAIVNYLVLLGWNPGNEREIFSLEELVQEFNLDRVQKSPATFNYEKLDDINRQHLLNQDAAFVAQEIVAFLPADVREQFEQNPTKGEKIMQMVIMERIKKFADAAAMADAGEFAMFFLQPEIEKDLIMFKDATTESTRDNLLQLVDKLDQINESDWNKDYIKDTLWDWTAEIGRGYILHPMRTALSGSKQSPDPFTIADILGKDETIQRLQLAITDILSN